ncbi:hypothetical protein Cgig2_020497 [Carnegiea gigantea]|uniref:K Homology domain-containing protein n=1 Tax=Carnegiea gigantea TaxID=171969 RepID=A0A9Q1QFL0_9CARY|nr:hypothetical protein Cgig2_020497 [Carnegiea gigantea]
MNVQNHRTPVDLVRDYNIPCQKTTRSKDLGSSDEGEPVPCTNKASGGQFAQTETLPSLLGKRKLLNGFIHLLRRLSCNNVWDRTKETFWFPSKTHFGQQPGGEGGGKGGGTTPCAIITCCRGLLSAPELPKKARLTISSPATVTPARTPPDAIETASHFSSGFRRVETRKRRANLGKTTLLRCARSPATGSPVETSPAVIEKASTRNTSLNQVRNPKNNLDLKRKRGGRPRKKTGRRKFSRRTRKLQPRHTSYKGLLVIILANISILILLDIRKRCVKFGVDGFDHIISSEQERSEGDIIAEPENVAGTEQSENESCIESVVRAIADSTISSSSLRAENEVSEAEETAASPTSTCQDDVVKNAENTLGGATPTSASQDDRAGGTKTILAVSKEKYAISVEIGASVMRFIKGKNGSTQKSIEEDMGVKIKFPSSRKDDSVVIEGDSLNAVSKASEKILAVINEAVKSPSLDYSHFISLPLAVYPELVDKLVRFQTVVLGDNDPNDVAGIADGVSSENNEDEDEVKPEKAPDVAVQLNVDDDTDNVKVALDVPFVGYAPKVSKKSRTLSGIDKSIFIKPKTFHLTILMLKLWNKERVHAAIEVLQRVSSKVMEALENRPLFLRLRGLDLMRGSRTKAHVLYAPVEEIGNEGRLLQVITDAYVEAGLVLEKDIGQKLKLHATLMNTSHSKVHDRKGKWRSIPFDATKIFEQFESEHWGDYRIREAHLSQRFLYDENGYYHCCASMPFPDDPSTSS